MFEELTRKLDGVFKKLRGQGKITEANIAETLREVRRVLLEADVNYQVARQFISDVQHRAIGQEVLTSITPAQLIIKIIHDELIRLLGEAKAEIRFAALPPTVVMVTGLQGSGKTTFAAKLALFLKSKGRYPMLVAADIYRPAAVDQLEKLGDQIHVPVHVDSQKHPVDIAAEGVEHARKAVSDVVIIDTAGRLHIDEQMMKEIEAIKSRIHPDETLFVVDSMTGQDAVTAAKAFHDRLGFDGIALTKLDGDARGGAALSIRAVINKPIKFASVGEKLDALEPFYPDRMASRILGMGDVVTLVEKAQQQFDEQRARNLEAKLRKAEFTFEDFLEQLQQIKKMGPLDHVLGMIPGFSRVIASTTIDDKALVRIEAIIQSMTREERCKPQIINGSRRQRIARGSGTRVQEVNRVMKHFADMQRMMKRFSKSGLKKIVPI